MPWCLLPKSFSQSLFNQGNPLKKSTLYNPLLAENIFPSPKIKNTYFMKVRIIVKMGVRPFFTNKKKRLPQCLSVNIGKWQLKVLFPMIFVLGLAVCRMCGARPFTYGKGGGERPKKVFVLSYCEDIPQKLSSLPLGQVCDVLFSSWCPGRQTFLSR